MKLIKTIIIASICVYLASCDVTESTDIDIEFEQSIVIESELIKDSLFAGVSIAKTIPLGESYNIQNSEVKDAIAILKINEGQVIPLHYNDNGIYMPLPEHFLFIKGGSTYELLVEIDDKSYYAKTSVPNDPVIRNVTYESENYLSAQIRAKFNEAYAATWVVKASRNPVESQDFHSVVSSEDVSPEVVIRTQTIDEQYLSSSFKEQTFLRVYTFDKQFEDFFKTFGNSKSITDAFSQSNGKVNWNIVGENVIGLFIGYSKSSLIKP